MKRTNKGFTLAELLIVVAVIAVLVAVAIPTFNNQLEKSRQATDLSNLRDAYATAKLAEINQETPAVNASGKAIKPTKIGSPSEALRMSTEAAKNYSGIGYAFVYDPDSGILYPYSTVDLEGEFIDFSNPTEEPELVDNAYSYSPFVFATTTPAPADAPAYVNGSENDIKNPEEMFAHIPNNTIGTGLKARSQEVRVETSNLPGGDKGAIQYGIPVGTGATGSSINQYIKDQTLRLWGDTAPDWANVRIIVEFSYDKSTSTWTLKRVKNNITADSNSVLGSKAYVNGSGTFTSDTAGNTSIDTTAAELGAIRFSTMGLQNETGKVCPKFTPVDWTSYVTSANIS